MVYLEGQGDLVAGLLSPITHAAVPLSSFLIESPSLPDHKPYILDSSVASIVFFIIYLLTKSRISPKPYTLKPKP